MKKSRVKPKKPPGLMLTSLLDMFTIILIFLIVSFEAEDYEFTLRPDLTLPESSARSVFKPAVNVALTSGGVFIEKEQVYTLSAGRAKQEDYDGQQIPVIVDLLKKKFQAIDMPSPEDEEAGDEDPAIILVQADKGLDYDTIYLVLRSASIAGFVRYRLAIMKK